MHNLGDRSPSPYRIHHALLAARDAFPERDHFFGAFSGDEDRAAFIGDDVVVFLHEYAVHLYRLAR